MDGESEVKNARDEKEEDEDEEADSPIPIDRGWAWMVVAGTYDRLMWRRVCVCGVCVW